MPVDSGRPIIEAIINGHGPFSFIFDTGAGITVLSTGLVKHLGIESMGAMRVGDPAAPEAVSADTYMLTTISVGSATFTDVEVIGMEGIEGLGVSGIVGMPLFNEWVITLDFPQERFKLSQTSLGLEDGSIAYTTDESEIVNIELNVAGRVITSHLDTGSPGQFMVPMSVASDLPLGSEPRVVRQVRTVSGAFDIYSAQLNGVVKFGGVQIDDPSLNFTDRFSVGNIGTGALLNYTMSIDQSNSRYRVQETGDGNAGAAHRQMMHGSQKPRYGIGFATENASMVVRQLAHGGAAEQAGMQLGDVLLQINGVDASEMDAKAQRASFGKSPITLTIDRDGKRLEIEMRFN